MATAEFAESRRRTIVKSLAWRLIGIVWTWVGAYIIILMVPPTWKNAPVIATLIVVYHHSTRMIMYYFYERLWANIGWGKYDPGGGVFAPMSRRDKALWTLCSLAVLVVIFFLLIYVTPLLKLR